jgi:signal transduction histidine kinase
MEIRKKILYQFAGIVALILILTLTAIYFSFSGSRREEFYDRLDSKARMVAQMLIEIDEIDAELLRRIERNNPLNLPREKIIIYDYRDTIVYSTDDEHYLDISADLIDEVRLNQQVRLEQNPFEILGQFYTGRYDRYVVFAAATDIYGIGKLKRLRIILLIAFFLSLIIVYFSGRIFASRALKPISDIMSEVDEIGIANLDARVSEGSGKDELARLAQTFNKMLDRLETAFRTQKNFINNASHELRTPLTAITGQLEVILMKARRNEEYKKTISSVLEDIRNLNQISNRLLLLAQASSEYSAADFSSVRIDDILWQVRKEILKRHDDYRIGISFSGTIDDEQLLTLKANELLIKTALSNLVDNGCKYSEDHTSTILIGNDNRYLIMHFSDNGIGIPEEETGMIFQPFYRASNTVGIKGHGIGLSLVERIVALHGGSIDVSSELRSGTEFTLYLPLEHI